MTVEHHPVQNSEVYLLTSTYGPSFPLPSPPSPATPCELALTSSAGDLLSITPPEVEISSPCSTVHQNWLPSAVHVLSTEATALSYLTRLYETDPIARGGFNAAVEAITRFRGEKGKLVICGVGKSGHIAKKLVATMNSLKIHSTYLHPTEALHGDLGKVGKYDTILLITFSGKTPELLSLLPHFDSSLPLLAMTSHTHPSTCEIIKHRPNCILLPAPIHQSETDSFGFNAPTTSTTMALALGDALAVVISNELHVNVQSVFSQNHPGGAIGQAFAPKTTKTIKDVAIKVEDLLEVGSGPITGAHILMAAYRSKSGWVKHGDEVVAPPRRIKRLQNIELDEPATCISDLMVQRNQWVEVASDTEMSKAIAWAKNRHLAEDTVLALIQDLEIVGFLEVGELSI